MSWVASDAAKSPIDTKLYIKLYLFSVHGIYFLSIDWILSSYYNFFFSISGSHSSFAFHFIFGFCLSLRNFLYSYLNVKPCVRPISAKYCKKHYCILIDGSISDWRLSEAFGFFSLKGLPNFAPLIFLLFLSVCSSS